MNTSLWTHVITVQITTNSL